MERRRRKDSDIIVGGRPATTKSNPPKVNSTLPPTALELAYRFLETGSLEDNKYYQTRWRFYENWDVE